MMIRIDESKDEQISLRISDEGWKMLNEAWSLSDLRFRSEPDKTENGDFVDRNETVILFSLTAMAFLLRFVSISYQSIWYDEAVTAEMVAASFGKLIRGDVADLGNPPLYLILCRVWTLIFGHSEIALRSFSAIVGGLAVPLLARLGRRLCGIRVGLIAAALLTISPMAVELSNEARVYALFLFLTIANMLFFVDWYETRRRASLVIYAVTMVLCLYSHYYALAIPLVQGLVVVAAADRRRLVGPWLGTMAVAGILCLFWAPAFLRQVTRPGNLTRMSQAWREQFLSTPLVFGLGRTFVWRDSGKVALGLSTLAVFVCFGFPAVRGLIRLRSRPMTMIMLASWLLIPIVGPLFVALLGHPLYATRYAIIGLPAFLLLVAIGFVGLRPIAQYLIAAVVLTMTATSLFRYSTLPLKDDWRSATQAIVSEIGDDDLLIFSPDDGITPFRYYLHRMGGKIPSLMMGITDDSRRNEALFGSEYHNDERLDSVSHDVAGRLGQYARVQVVLSPAVEGPEVYKALLEKNGYRLEKVDDFHRIMVLRFTKENPSARSL